MQPVPALSCPQCNDLSYVRKASAVVEEGSSEGVTNSRTTFGGVASQGFFEPTTTFGGKARTTTTSFAQTQLASKLSPPPPPAPPFGVGELLSLAAVLGGIIVLIGIFVPAFVSNLLCLGWFGLLALMTAASISGSRRTRQQLVPQWQHARGRWDYLYYCARCDGVFIPGDPVSGGQFVPASGMQQLLLAGYIPPLLQAPKP